MVFILHPMLPFSVEAKDNFLINFRHFKKSSNEIHILYLYLRNILIIITNKKK
jgi:hypothetical protein